MTLLKKTKHNHGEWKKSYKDLELQDYGESMTVPNQAMSIKEIIDRHARGLEIPVSHAQKWLDHEELVPQLRDLTDIDQAKQYLDEVQAKIDDERARVLEKEQEINEKKPPEPTE